MSKFKIPVIPSTTQRSIRLPNDLIEKIESKIIGKDTTFSAFVVSALRWAIENLDEQEEEKNIRTQ